MDIPEYNFTQYKQLLCTAYQTQDFKEAIEQFRSEYRNRFSMSLPYPMGEDQEDWEIVYTMLQDKIDQEDLLPINLISKSEAIQRYKLNNKFFILYYTQPEKQVLLADSKELYGKKQYSSLYNVNRIIQILESEEYQLNNKKRHVQ
jgi:hypothetical protein